MDMNQQDEPVQPVAAAAAQSPQEQEYQAFLGFHSPQLKAMGLPESLWKRLFNKLKFEDYDLGQHVQLLVDEDDEQMCLRTLKDMRAEGDVFLVDHCWTFKQRTFYKDLKANEKLRERLDNIMRFPEKRDLPIEGGNPYAKKRPALEEYLQQLEAQTEPVLEYDLDEYGIKSLKEIKFREEVEEISLWGNEILNPNDIATILMKLPNLKALWLNGNPVETNCSNFNIIGDHFDKLEIFNSQLTVKAGEWAMLFYARESGAKKLEDIKALDLKGKNLLAVDDISFLKRMTSLRVLDISDNLDMYKPKAMREQEAMQAAAGSGQSFEFRENKHERDFFLEHLDSVEHLICDIMLEAYILEMRPKRNYLPNLKTINRVSIAEADLGKRTVEKKVLGQIDNLWRYAGSYRLVKPGVMDQEPTFFIMDEVGSAITHSEKPNTTVAPVIFSPNNEFDDPKTMTYSVLWLTEDIPKEKYLYRDYLNGITEKEWRSARYLPWFNVFPEYFAEEYDKFLKDEPHINALALHEEYQGNNPSPSPIEWDVDEQGPVPVYTDYDELPKYLNDARFKLVNEPKEAKILWLTTAIKEEDDALKAYGLEESECYFNYFKAEQALVDKAHLSQLVNKTLKDKSCIKETYDLAWELPCFIGAFLDREKKGLDNTWIVKPTNLARSIDTWVVNNVDQIVRLMDTGPKIAQKYVERPLLFQGRKFTLRYVVLLKSVLPLQLYRCNEFYTQFSNNQFDISESTFHEYETHFTVMNYGTAKAMTNIRCEPWIEQFDAEQAELYAGNALKFADIQTKIDKVIADVYIAFQARYAQKIKDLGNIDKQRALYGVDILIEADGTPKLLEVTFAPDMGRFGKF